MRAIDMYRYYRHRQVSKEVLDRLEQLLPTKRYLEVKKFNKSLEGDQPEKEAQAIIPTQEDVIQDAGMA